MRLFFSDLNNSTAISQKLAREVAALANLSGQCLDVLAVKAAELDPSNKTAMSCNND